MLNIISRDPHLHSLNLTKEQKVETLLLCEQAWAHDLLIPAVRAYKQAISTLTTLRAHPPQHTFDPALANGNGHSKSIFSSFLPNLQGQGPIGSVVRIILKLHSSVNRVASVLSPETLGLGTKKKDEELRGKAIKVIDLLQHSAELGNMDALFTLAQVSLVSLPSHQR
jgi:SEL1 protein